MCGNGGSGGHSGWQRTKLATVAGGGGLTIQQKNDFVNAKHIFETPIQTNGFSW